MRYYYFVFVLFACSVHAQNIVFADEAFKQQILESSPDIPIAFDSDDNPFAVDANGNNEIEVSEALLVRRLFLEDEAIQSIADLQNFTNLENFGSYWLDLPATIISGLPHLAEFSVQFGNVESLEFSNLPSLNVVQAEFCYLQSVSLNSCPNVHTLKLGQNELTVLNVSGMANLKNIIAHTNQIAQFDFAGASALETLNFALGNPIPGLDFSNLTSLKSFTAYGSSIGSLNFNGCVNLESLIINTSLVASLDVQGCEALHTIEATAGRIATLVVENLPALTALRLSGSELINLTVANCAVLDHVGVSGSHVNNLEILNCPLLTSVFASENQISELNISQTPSLSELYIKNNLFQSIDVSGFPMLESLDVSYNQINSLDVSSLNHILILNVGFNPMETLFVKNGRFEGLAGHHTLTTLRYVCADENEIASLLYDFEFNNLNDVVVNSYCSQTPGAVYNTISGSLLLSESGDCVGMPVPGVKFSISADINQDYAFTDQAGQFRYYVRDGEFTFEALLENPDYFTVSPAAGTAFFETNEQIDDYSQAFCLTPNGNHTDVEIAIVPTEPARPGFDAAYEIIYRNKGNQPQSGVVNLTYPDDRLDFVSASQTPASQTPNVTSFGYADLQPFESRTIAVIYNVNGPMETPAVNIDDHLLFSAAITVTANDESPADNNFDLNQLVVGAFDPNDKVCAEGRVVSPDKIGGYLHYVINFENTGTFAAERVVVIDDLDPDAFDVSSFKMLATSHPMQSRIVSNKAEFFFENIDLAPNATGFVAFKIKTKNTLSTGASVMNKANIFFDYNFPIETDPAITTFQNLGATDVTDATVAVAPNPTSGILEITADSTIKSVSLYDIQGRIVRVDMPKTLEHQLDLTFCKSGLYLVKVITSKGVAVHKISRK